jgi:peptidoglycan/LPS O-acetylase OafA/YrhL
VTQNYRADIDGLRAVAVVLVVAFHAFPGLVRGGFVGVDVFFVISGYLISGNILSGLQSGYFTLSDFYIRRARRILPALAVTLIGTLVIGWLVLLPKPYQSLGLDTLAGALFFPNLAFWKEAGYFDAAAETKPLLHLWSLGVEEQFYLVWPVLLMILNKRQRWLVAILCAIVAASLAYSCYATLYSPAAGFYSPLSRLWELGIGGILAALALRPRNNDLLSFAGIALIVASALLLDRTSPFPGALAIVPVAGSALVIVSGSTILAHKWPEVLGKISYPLYLWHWPLLSFAAMNGVATIPQRILIIAASLVLAWLTWRFIEKPIRFGKLKRSGVGFSVAAMIGLAGCSALVFFDGGVPQRFAREIRPVLATMSYGPATDARLDCWLDATQPFAAYGAECRSGATLIWGDSHAGRLAPGFKQAEVAQFVRDGCMPSLGVAQNVCDASNALIVEEIARLKPRRVILFAAWPNYDLHDVESFRSAVKRLKQSVDDVVILGPAPVWTPDLPTAVFNFWTANKRLPDRLPPAPKNYRELDAILSAIAAAEHTRFISVFAALCNEDGCLTHTPSSPSDLLSWDYGHLTTSGADFVLQSVKLN